MSITNFLKKDLSGVGTTPATSVPLPTTGAPEPPATDQYPVTPTTPPIVETTTHSVTDKQPETGIFDKDFHIYLFFFSIVSDVIICPIFASRMSTALQF